MTASPLDPRDLAAHANVPLPVVRLMFAAAGNDAETVRLLRSASIDRETMWLRRAIITAAKWHTSATLEQLGRAFNRDHSTIQRWLADAKAMHAEEPEFRAFSDRIVEVCAGSRRAA